MPAQILNHLVSQFMQPNVDSDRKLMWIHESANTRMKLSELINGTVANRS